MAMDSSKMPVSIYTPVEDDDKKSMFLLDKYATDDSNELIDNIILKETLKKLSKRDKQIIMLRFFRDKTQSEIAKELGVSQVQVSRLENKIISQIKESLNVNVWNILMVQIKKFRLSFWINGIFNLWKFILRFQQIEIL